MKFKIKNLKNKIIYSILISLAIHLCLMIWSFFVKITMLEAQREQPTRLMRVKVIHEKQEDKTSKKNDPAPEKKDLTVSDDKPEFVSVDRTELVKIEQNLSEEINNKPIVSAEESGALKLLDVQKKDVPINKMARRQTRKQLVDVGDVPKKDFEPGAPELADTDVSKNYLEKSLASLMNRALEPVPAKRVVDEFKLMKNFDSGIKPKNVVSDLGDTLSYELFSYTDPKDGQKYFKVSIKVKTVAPNLPSIPKEIIIVLDASNSIGDKRLEQYKKGIAASLNSLNPSDYFNIIVFKDKTFSLSEKSLIRSDANIQSALGFVEMIQASARTDMYGALKESLHLDSHFRPSYRLLLSDGFPTKGVTDSRRVINDISDLNKGQVCIFSLGGGVNISEYMLDFVAYKNRGWAEYTRRDNLIAQKFTELYEKIKDPILVRPRYYTSGFKEEELYPKMLPDFFRGAEFVLYGTYMDENKFYIQLLGDLITQTKRIIVRGELKEAAEGDKSIAYQWAFHKVYHLISQLKYNEDNAGILQQIDGLSKKFNIVTPYSRNFRK